MHAEIQISLNYMQFKNRIGIRAYEENILFDAVLHLRFPLFLSDIQYLYT